MQAREEKSEPLAGEYSSGGKSAQPLIIYRQKLCTGRCVVRIGHLGVDHLVSVVVCESEEEAVEMIDILLNTP